jgi:hypothetical protein
MISDEMNFTEEQYAAVSARIAAFMPWQLAWNSTVAFLTLRNDTLQTWGTGTLLKIADEHLLITATHVIEFANAKDLFVLRADMKNKDDIIPLEAEGILAPRDSLDVAILRLRQQAVERLGEGAFLRLDHFRYDQGASDAIFAVIGSIADSLIPATTSGLPFNMFVQ